MTLNHLQTHISHIDDNSYAPFTAPTINMSMEIVDVNSVLHGARYAVQTTFDALLTSTIPVHGVNHPYEIKTGADAIESAVNVARNKLRHQMEEYAHQLYQPMTDSVSQVHTTLTALCDAFFASDGGEAGDHKDVPLDVLLERLASAEELLRRILEGHRAYRAHADFKKAPGDA